jgi:hypothetical protein
VRFDFTKILSIPNASMVLSFLQDLLSRSKTVFLNEKGGDRERVVRRMNNGGFILSFFESMFWSDPEQNIDYLNGLSAMQRTI